MLFIRKNYKNKIDRKIFGNTGELMEYIFRNIDTLFNAGFDSAEIRLYRLHHEGDMEIENG